MRLNHDNDWAIKERERLQTPKEEITKLAIFDRVDRIVFIDENGNQVATLKTIIHNLYPQGFQELSPTKMTHSFSEPTFIATGVPKFPRLKVNSVEATLSVVKVLEEVKIDLWDVVGFILKNVLESTYQTFDKNLKLRK